MAINYTWHVSGLEKHNTESLQEVVSKVTWFLTGTDDVDNIKYIMIGVTNLDTSGMDPNSFIAYPSLSEETVVQWVQTLESGNMDYYHSVIEEGIAKNRMQAVSVMKGHLPWDPPTGA